MFDQIGQRFNNYPAHPSFVRAHKSSPNWTMTKAPGSMGAKSKSKTINIGAKRSNAVFSYIGPKLNIRL